MRSERKVQASSYKILETVMKSLDVILNLMGSQWKTSKRGIKLPELHFKKITPGFYTENKWSRRQGKKGDKFEEISKVKVRYIGGSNCQQGQQHGCQKLLFN